MKILRKIGRLEDLRVNMVSVLAKLRGMTYSSKLKSQAAALRKKALSLIKDLTKVFRSLQPPDHIQMAPVADQFADLTRLCMKLVRKSESYIRVDSESSSNEMGQNASRCVTTQAHSIPLDTLLNPNYNQEVKQIDLSTFLDDSTRMSLASFLEPGRDKFPSLEMQMVSEEQRVMRKMIPLGELEPLNSKPKSYKDRVKRLEDDVADLMSSLFVEKYHSTEEIPDLINSFRGM